MKIGNLSGGIGMVDVALRSGAFGHPGRPKPSHDGRLEKVADATAKDRSGSSTDRGRGPAVPRVPRGG